MIVLATIDEYRWAMREFSTIGDIAVLYSQLTMGRISARWGALVPSSELRAFEAGTVKARSRDSEHAFEKLTHVVDGRLQIVSRPLLIVPIEDLMPEAEWGCSRRSCAPSCTPTPGRCCPIAVACWNATTSCTWHERLSAWGAWAPGAGLGRSSTFDQALADFAAGYATQNEQDYQALVKAAKSGRITAVGGV